MHDFDICKHIIWMLLMSVLVCSCSKEDASSKKETDRPYTRYLLTDYGSYVEIPDRPALNPGEGITLEGWVQFAESSSVLTPSAKPLFLAKNVPAHTGIAEFRLWNTARTQSDIKEDMLKNISKPTAGLVAVWQLHKDANDLIDGYHGVLHNNPTFKIWSD